MDELILISDETLELKPCQPDEFTVCSLKKITDWLKIKIVYTPREHYNSVPGNKSSLVHSMDLI